MSVISVKKDPESLTMTVTAELDATVERAWQLWADPRQFEQWWGPPGYRATVVDHDVRAGGRITFFMAGTEGERHDSTWEVIAADPPRRLELRDADVDDEGRPNDGNAMTALLITIRARRRGLCDGDPHPLRLSDGHGGGACHGDRRRHAQRLLANRNCPRRHTCVKG